MQHWCSELELIHLSPVSLTNERVVLGLLSLRVLELFELPTVSF